MELRYHLLDVFTDRPFGGNQLAVFPEPPELDPGLMQRIARELNLSETVFVYPSTDPAALRKLRIFTPESELPFAGHPTIGTACLLATLGTAGGGRTLRFAFEEGVGLVPVTVERTAAGDLKARLTAARLPETGPPAPPPAALAPMLNLDPGDILTGSERPEGASAGVRFLIVPLSGRAALGRARLDLGRWRDLLADWWAPQVYLYCREPEAPGAHFRVRMFAPSMGIVEDPATGAAAAAFAGYLAGRAPERDGTLAWIIEQGIEMGRPSRIEIEADKRDGAVTALRVGGTAVLMGEGVLRLRPR